MELGKESPASCQCYFHVFIIMAGNKVVRGILVMNLQQCDLKLGHLITIRYFRRSNVNCSCMFMCIFIFILLFELLQSLSSQRFSYFLSICQKGRNVEIMVQVCQDNGLCYVYRLARNFRQCSDLVTVKYDDSSTVRMHQYNILVFNKGSFVQKVHDFEEVQIVLVTSNCEKKCI